MVNSIYQLVSVRLYDNPHFGKKMGPAQTNPYIFNASIEFPSGAPRMHADLATFKDMAHSFDPVDFAELSDAVTQLATSELGYAPVHDQHFIAGQLFELYPKTYFCGAVALSMLTWRGFIFLSMDGKSMDLKQLLRFRFCPNVDAKGRAPTYIGANHDLNRSPVKRAPAVAPNDAAAILEKLRTGGI